MYGRHTLLQCFPCIICILPSSVVSGLAVVSSGSLVVVWSSEDGSVVLSSSCVGGGGGVVSSSDEPPPKKLDILLLISIGENVIVEMYESCWTFYNSSIEDTAQVITYVYSGKCILYIIT